MNTVVENNVSIELYRNKDIPKNDIPQLISNYKSKAESLGFTGVAKLVEQKAKSIVASKAYHKLNTKELNQIDQLFPTKYVDGPNRYIKTLQEYMFDVIPLGVLEEYKIARESELFDTLLIRTPEKEVISDPVLLGVIGNDVFLLARWGEALKPISELYNRAFMKTVAILSIIPIAAITAFTITYYATDNVGLGIFLGFMSLITVMFITAAISDEI